MKHTILIVDDNPKNLQILAALLYENNYNVEVASSGKNAIKWLENTSFDTILLDIMMPELDGFETCKIIKSKPNYKHIPIIFLTAKNDIESIEKGFDVGGVDYITKPFNQKELLIRIKTQIELKTSKDKLINVNNWLNDKVEEKTFELKNAYDQIKQVNEQLSKLDDAKSYFLSSISHELRTPLNSIVGSIGLLKKLNHNNKVNEIISLLDSSVNNLEKYSYSALQISHLQLKGDSLLSLKQINPSPILHSLYNKFLKQAKNNDINFTIKHNKSETYIIADYNLIQIALTSIIECTFSHTINGFVKIETEVSNNEYKIDFIDSGEKYSGDNINHFFKTINNKDYQIKRNNAIELYLAQLIISLHKGKLEFSNTETGTNTTIIFPINNLQNINTQQLQNLSSEKLESSKQ